MYKKAIRRVVIVIMMLMLVETGANPIKQPIQVFAEETVPESQETVEVVDETQQGAFKLAFTDEKERKTVDVPYNKMEYTPQVKPYTVAKDLGNIENLEQYGNFTEQQKKKLQENNFFIDSTDQEQLFYIYEDNEYKKIPSFVTTDSVLHTYHIFYDYSLRTLEAEKLLAEVEQLTENMLNKSINVYNHLENVNIQNIQLKNIAYFAVAQLALQKELPEAIPQEALSMAQKEYEQIKAQGGFMPSNIFPYDLDYSQYTPRGHYTRSEELKRYFGAMMWYGQAPFPLYVYKGTEKERNVDQTLQALLITYTLFIENNGATDIAHWENLYDPTQFYVGSSDDLNIYQYKDLLINVYGQTPDINQLDNADKLNQVYKKAEVLPEPLIQGDYTCVTTPTGKQFRLLGQRYLPDSEIIQNLVKPIVRPIPSGLDVMGVLGSNRAYEIQTKVEQVQKHWNGYIDKFNVMKNKFDKVPESKWQSNMYYGWLWVLKDFLHSWQQGYPSFMTNQAWEDKSLNTALGSWAELRHDTILYGKQSGAECGGGEEPPQIKGYVEPNVEVYEKLRWLTAYSKVNLDAKGLLTESMKGKMENFEQLLAFLRDCSLKELKNEELTQQEYYELLVYGGNLEYLMSSFAGDDLRWFELTSETDKNMAMIADVHTVAPNEYDAGGYFEVGVARAQEIFVVVPIGGKLYLNRGATFGYYEFLQRDKRMTDEQWQDMLKTNKAPSQPQWMESFMTEKKQQIPTPEEPYSICR
jgi:hypothetical protein